MTDAVLLGDCDGVAVFVGEKVWEAVFERDGVGVGVEAAVPPEENVDVADGVTDGDDVGGAHERSVTDPAPPLIMSAPAPTKDSEAELYETGKDVLTKLEPPAPGPTLTVAGVRPYAPPPPPKSPPPPPPPEKPRTAEPVLPIPPLAQPVPPLKVVPTPPPLPPSPPTAGDEKGRPSCGS